MSAIRQKRFSCLSLPHPYCAVPSCGGNTSSISLPGYGHNPTGMNVVFAQECSAFLRKQQSTSLTPYYRRCGSVRSICDESSLPQHMQRELYRILCCQLLACTLVLPFFAISPVTNCLDDYPVHFPSLCSRVETSAFHLTANRFRSKFA